MGGRRWWRRRQGSCVTDFFINVQWPLVAIDMVKFLCLVSKKSIYLKCCFLLTGISSRLDVVAWD